jgi:hypothetical protein
MREEYQGGTAGEGNFGSLLHSSKAAQLHGGCPVELCDFEAVGLCSSEVLKRGAAGEPSFVFLLTDMASLVQIDD